MKTGREFQLTGHLIQYFENTSQDTAKITRCFLFFIARYLCIRALLYSLRFLFSDKPNKSTRSELSWLNDCCNFRGLNLRWALPHLHTIKFISMEGCFRLTCHYTLSCTCTHSRVKADRLKRKEKQRQKQTMKLVKLLNVAWSIGMRL